jgi:hypothetical protein
MPVNGGIRAAGRLSVFAMLLFASCGSEAPVGPSPVSGPPNVTGQWIGTLVETKGDRRTFELTMTLSQVPGGSRVTGNIVTVLRSARFTETIILGTFDGSTIDLTANSDEFPTTYVYQGTLVDNGRSLLGTSHVVNNAACCSWTARRVTARQSSTISVWSAAGRMCQRATLALVVGAFLNGCGGGMSSREVEPVAGSGPSPTPVPTPAPPGFLFLHSTESPYRNPRVFSLEPKTLELTPLSVQFPNCPCVPNLDFAGVATQLEGPFQFSRSESGSRLLTWMFQGTTPSFSLISRADSLVSHLALDPLGRFLFTVSAFQTVPLVQSWVIDQRSGGLHLIGSQPIGRFPTLSARRPAGTLPACRHPGVGVLVCHPAVRRTDALGTARPQRNR